MYSTIFLIFLFGSSYGSGNRVKRVTHGTQVEGRTGPYEAVLYTVGMGSLHGRKWYAFGFKRLKDSGIYGRHNCGGSLLTPSIVQTACHCVAFFDANSNNSEPIIRNNWESSKVVYIGLNERFAGDGSSDSWMNKPPVKSRKFFTSQKCRKQPREDEPGPPLYSFDTGYIVIDPAWIKGDLGVPTAGVKFAPIYTVEYLRKTYNAFTQTPPVCLNLGWGFYDEKGEASSVLRSGWTSIMEQIQCQWATVPYWSQDVIAQYMSWVCGDNIPNLFQPADSGDSGGPVSCNNVYFGVQAAVLVDEQDFPPEFKEYRVNSIEALINSEYQNTVDFRKSFEAEIADWVRSFPEIRERHLRNFQKVQNPTVRGISTSKNSSRLLSYEHFVDSFATIQVPSVGLAILLIFMVLP